MTRISESRGLGRAEGTASSGEFTRALRGFIVEKEPFLADGAQKRSGPLQEEGGLTLE